MGEILPKLMQTHINKNFKKPYFPFRILLSAYYPRVISLFHPQHTNKWGENSQKKKILSHHQLPPSKLLLLVMVGLEKLVLVCDWRYFSFLFLFLFFLLFAFCFLLFAFCFFFFFFLLSFPLFLFFWLFPFPFVDSHFSLLPSFLSSLSFIFIKIFKARLFCGPIYPNCA